ncbi:MAG TPA: UDP-N-acetylmuramoyl-tripeptide--D-alanyl-D-alanine ligase [Vicinamibacterales bacterium]|nr:UDP-N-acetylmuramoyl-tripeptide--D-alanyl-D-alanine ligase [Vicinamibacterales bacterium]
MSDVVSAFLLTAGLVAEATGGQLISGDPGRVFDAISTDSRTLMPVPASARGAGTLFIALSGPTFDGHTFLPDALAKGVAGVLVAVPPVIVTHAAVIVVSDPLVALQRLGHEVRRRSHARVVAITGSAGKTTTKEATAACLAPRYRVFSSVGNLNNHIGLPLSLLELRHGADVGVVELGMNHAGEISTLVALAEPDVRVWTNVGDAHIGHFGSADAIADAKAELLEGAGAATIVVANADDARVMQHVSRCPATVRTFGFQADADVRAAQFEDRGFDGTRTSVTTPWGALSLELALAGRANVLNVLAAATVALELGVPPADVARAASGLKALRQRGAVRDLASGVRLVDDSYNASPAAVTAMLATLAATATTGRRVAVIGEMRELGDAALALHTACGRAAGAAGIDVLVAIGGPAADGLIDGACEAGMTASQLFRFADSGAAAGAVSGIVRAGDLVLVKGSRGTHTELVSNRLAEVA